MTSHPAESSGRKDRALEELWEICLRRRVPRISDLPGIGFSPTEIEAMRASAARSGQLGEDGDELDYDWPVSRLSEYVRVNADRVVRDLARQTQHLVGLLEHLPALTHAWQLGEPEGQRIAVDVVRGPHASRRAWTLYGVRGVNPSFVHCAPDMLELGSPEYDPGADAAEHTGATSGRTRVLLTSSVVETPGNRERLLPALDLGVELRHHPALPSWFWASDKGVVALPGRWGQMTPDVVLVFTQPVIAAALHALYERLWSEALPLRGTAQQWDSLLEMLMAGSQIEAASRALGISVRTGRRRIADAMEHYGVSNIFGLGAAWAKEHA